MAFSHSRNVQVFDSSFIDVQGNMNIYQPVRDVVLEPGLQILMRATSTGAAFDSHERYPAPRCHPETRKDVITTLQRWIRAASVRDTASILWLHGPAGAGKSAVAQTISESCAQDGQLAASFFFSRGMPTRDSMAFLFPTIAFQLAMSLPIWRERINRIVTDDPSVVHRAPAIQLDKLVVGALLPESLERDQQSSRSPFLIVIDGLDECKGSRDQTTILNLTSSLAHIPHLPLSFLIISRPEPHIASAFEEEAMHRICTYVSLYGLHASAWHDVYTYLHSSFDDIHSSERHAAVMRSVPKPWPGGDVIEKLVMKSGGYFIYASTVLKYIDEEFFSPIKRLSDVLKTESLSSASKPFAELDKLYRHILLSNPNTELVKQVLGYLMFLSRRSVVRQWDKIDVVIETIARLDTGEVLLSLRGLHSLISIGTYTKLEDGVLQIHINSVELFHASFEDFLFDESRAGNLFIDIDEEIICCACFNSFNNWEKMNTPHEVRVQIFNEFKHCFQRMSRQDLLPTLKKYFDQPSWTSLICSSAQWNIDSREKVVALLHWVTDQLQKLDHPPEGPTEQFMALSDFTLQTYLSLGPGMSAADILFIEGLETVLDSHVMRSRDQAKIADYHAHLLDLTSSYCPHWIRICETLCSPFRKTCVTSFLDDQRRSGVLFAPAPLRHARLALCCLKLLQTTTGVWYVDSYTHDYARTFWAHHISHSPPGSEDLLSCLQLFSKKLATRANFQSWYDTIQPFLKRSHAYPPNPRLRLMVLGEQGTVVPDIENCSLRVFRDNVFIINVRCLVGWLKKMDDPPIDILEPWISISTEAERVRK